MSHDSFGGPGGCCDVDAVKGWEGEENKNGERNWGNLGVGDLYNHINPISYG